MIEKPGKRLRINRNAKQHDRRVSPRRLVSKSQYATTVMGKSALYILAIFVSIAGLFFLAFTLFILTHFRSMAADMPILPCFVSLLFMGWMTFTTLKYSRSFYREAKDIEPVRPLTSYNVHQLSPEDSLVRASDLPPSHQQAELLRAVPQGSETPPEEMLRADTNRQRD